MYFTLLSCTIAFRTISACLLRNVSPTRDGWSAPLYASQPTLFSSSLFPAHRGLSATNESMSLAFTITSFCIDISPSMGRRRAVKEDVMDSDVGDTSEAIIRKVQTTDLEWVLDFVSRKIQNCILSKLKTARAHILLFGSPRTHNHLLRSTEVTEGYDGIDEIFLPQQADIFTLDLVRSLRAAVPEEKPHPADPLSAVIAAITTINDKKVGGVPAAASSWKKTIYIVTDGMTKFDKDGQDRIKEELIASNIVLKVVGIDFDDPSINFKEEGKNAVKAANEQWWREFLQDVPGCGLATAVDVMEQATLPSVQLQNSAPHNTTLFFGDPTNSREGYESLRLPVRVYKATALTRPLSQKKVCKLSGSTTQTKMLKGEVPPTSTPSYSWSKIDIDGAEQQDDPEIREQKWPTLTVQVHRKFYIREDLEYVEGGIDYAEPLPKDAETSFEAAYKLGASLVPVNSDIDQKLDTKDGMEIIQFTKKSTYRRYFNIGETSFVFASEDNYQAQAALSGIIRAMHEQDKYAIVRFVRRSGTDARIGILAPQMYDPDHGIDYECFYYCDAPFREDYSRLHLQPLDRAVDKYGEEVLEHPTLPNKRMKDCMDELVDCLDLTDAGEDEDGNPEPWFATEESYNPAIHNIKEAISRRVFRPDNDQSLPKPHPEVVKYLHPPEKVVSRASEAMTKCREAFELEYIATGAARRSAAKREAQQRADEKGENVQDKEIDLGGVMDEEIAQSSRQPENEVIGKSSKLDSPDSGSETEDDLDLGVHSQIKTPKHGSSQVEQQSEGHSPSDFENRLADPHNDIQEEIDNMGHTIEKLIRTGSDTKDDRNARDLLLRMRKGAIEYEEADRYNDFIQHLKSKLLAEDHNQSYGRKGTEFWDLFVRGREDLGLITNTEALQEDINVNTREAGEFINL